MEDVWYVDFDNQIDGTSYALPASTIATIAHRRSCKPPLPIPTIGDAILIGDGLRVEKALLDEVLHNGRSSLAAILV